MVASTYIFGHKAIWNEKTQRYHWADTGEAVTYDSRPCFYCGMYPTKEGFDPCLGLLSGVIAACCGHGVMDGYIIYNDWTEIKLPKIGEIECVEA